jgi:hypothetical protein
VRQFWAYYFGWYQGNVWPNLAASAVTGSLAAAFTVWRMRLHHERTRAQSAARHAAFHGALAAHREQTTSLGEQVTALHVKLDALTVPPPDTTADGGAQ